MRNSIVTLKDKCPYPDLYWAERPHSIIIETSQFDQATFDNSNLLNLLRYQYPQAISVNQRMIAKYNNRSGSSGKEGLFIEVGFPDNNARAKALNTPFILNAQTIQVTKTWEKPDFYHNIYRIQIYDIDKLNDPSKYYDEVLAYLSKYGQVLELHLHYTEVGNWFTGEGCAIWINKHIKPNNNYITFYDNEIKFQHPKLRFTLKGYYTVNQ